MRSPDAPSALAVAGLAACVCGLLGTDAGVLWLVAGVWTVRSLAGSSIGFAWGTACLGAAARWGTIGLGEVAVATRLAGPTSAAGPLLVRAGMLTALAAAIVDEARVDGLMSERWGERAAAAGALVGLAALFLVRGAGDPNTTLPLLWAANAVMLTGVVLAVRSIAKRVPPWALSLAAVVGVSVSMTSR